MCVIIRLAVEITIQLKAVYIMPLVNLFEHLDLHFGLRVSLEEGLLKEMNQHGNISHKSLHYCNKIF